MYSTVQNLLDTIFFFNLDLKLIYSALRPNDVCVAAPTGSGKTLAFVLPIIQSLKSRMVPKVRALVVLPTQDLALQVYKVRAVYSYTVWLCVMLIGTLDPHQIAVNARQNEFLYI